MNKALSPATLTVLAPETLESALKNGNLHAFQNASGFASCLPPLLSAIGWRGDPRQLAEALPHFNDDLDLVDLRNVLSHLRYRTQPTEANLRNIDARLLPCLFVPHSGPPIVLLDQTDKGYLVFDSESRTQKEIRRRFRGGTAIFIDRIDKVEQAASKRFADNWIANLAMRFRYNLFQMLGITFILNIFAISVPIFIMLVYDQVIGKKSPDTLMYLASGILAVIGFDLALRLIRARYMSYLAGRLDNIIGTAALRQILFLPPGYTENAPIGSQVSRLREFESLREFFTGPLANVVLEIPFVFLFLIVIAVLGGPLAVIPLAMIFCFGIMAALVLPVLRRAVATSGAARSKKHSFLVEMLTQIRAIKQAGAEGVWINRFRTLSARATVNGFKSAQLTFLVQTISHGIMMLAGIATLAMGAERVLAGDMSVGALIAVMAMVWRALSPMQMGFTLFTKLEEIRMGLRQLNSLMRLQRERDDEFVAAARRNFTGRIDFSRVSMRYPNANEASLLNITVNIEPGEMVAIIGPNGCGKSTIMKLMIGMYRQQGGAVLLDGLDIRQIDPIELRRAIGYVPQYCQLFHGTIAQNLRLAEPTANDQQIEDACILAGVWEDIQELPDGLETRIGDQKMAHLPSGFLQRISLARAYLKDCPILLLDEPGQTLDREGDQFFMDQLRAMKGHKTIVIISHRPSHIRLADRAVLLKDGVIAMMGAPDEILDNIPKGAL